MILKNGKEYYPLDLTQIMKDGHIYYDRNARGKNYFYLDFRGSDQRFTFIPAGADALVTADGLTVSVL